MRRTSVSLFLLVTVLALLVVPPPSEAQAAAKGLTLPVTGKAAHGGKVSGTFTVAQFVATGDPSNPIGALGTLVLETKDGRRAVTTATMPVTLASGAASSGLTAQLLTCEILELTLGPLDLNLLGLEVHLDTVHLVIEANPAGGLLGQLLCAIANLLSLGDILGNLAAILDLLNQLLDVL
jgi:hypothetical protein